MKKKRSFLKRVGGKYLILDSVLKILSERKCFIKLFIGSGDVFLNTNYHNYILGNIHNDLINLFNVVKIRFLDFIKDERALFTSRTSNLDFYSIIHRTMFNISSDTYQKAPLFLYLNRYCYNGLYGYNLKRKFNIPFSRYKQLYFLQKELYQFSEHAQKATFICCSYDIILKNFNKDSVVYRDPPYLYFYLILQILLNITLIILVYVIIKS